MSKQDLYDTNNQLQTPIVLIIFKRPNTTERVFEAIRQVKPTKLFLIADAARADREDEAEKCEATRAIVEKVDWDCQVFKNYSYTNRGVKWNIANGLNWVFDTVEEAIILEDDCLPHPTFFKYCEELLNYYRNDERVMTVSGNNFQFGNRRTEYSYYFSRYPHTWGWATWKRAWKSFDIEMKLWEKIRDENWLEFLLEDTLTVKNWTEIFQGVYEQKIIAWDYQWILHSWINSGLSIAPNVNLVTNIGFGLDATNTKDSNSPCANYSLEEMSFPLKHPPFVIRHTEADIFTQKTHFSPPTIVQRAVNKTRKILTSIM